jgi:Holliday junction resolvasome RuvABC endonuclease subunit
MIVGIDYSLTSPAICVFTGGRYSKFQYEKCKFYFLTDTKKYAQTWDDQIFGTRFSDYHCESQRYSTIADWATEHCMGASCIALEGYAYNAKGSSAFQLAENMGIFKYKLFELSLPLDVVAPTEVKKFATGKGNSDKPAMHVEFMKATKINLKNKITPDKSGVTNPVSDIVDAYFICRWLHSKMNSVR